MLEGTYPWYRGGVSEWVHQYLRAFADYDFQILQIATDEYLQRDVRYSLYDIPDNVHEFIRIPPPDLSKDWNIESERWLEANRQNFQSLLNDIDMVHVTNTGFAGWLGSELADELDKPLILTEHAIYWKEIDMGAVALECGYRIPSQERQKQRYVQMFQHMARKIYSKADVTVSVSKHNTKPQYALGVVNKRYIPNGVDESFFYLDDCDTVKETLTIGWIGRCANMKNPLRFFSLVDAFRTVPQIPVSFKMMLSDAGEPKLKDEVINRAEKYSEVQMIWNQSAIGHIKDWDAVCLTSYNESQPLVLFEAIANKSLPVGWSAGDANSNFGIFVNQEASPLELVYEIMQIWKDRERWINTVNTHFDFVRKHHTWKNVFSEYREIFESL